MGINLFLLYSVKQANKAKFKIGDTQEGNLNYSNTPVISSSKNETSHDHVNKTMWIILVLPLLLNKGHAAEDGHSHCDIQFVEFLLPFFKFCHIGFLWTWSDHIWITVMHIIC